MERVNTYFLNLRAGWLLAGMTAFAVQADIGPAFTGITAAANDATSTFWSPAGITRLKMATNLSIDPELIDRALALSGERTKKAAVSKALQEFIARREQKHLLELFGKLEWDVDYDYKAERSRQ